MSQNLQTRFQIAQTDYQKLQAELQTTVDARQRLDAQLSENKLVEEEFRQLTTSNTVYKLIGPVLVEQDQADAKNNVETRLEFIQSEIKRVEEKLADINKRLEEKKGELVKLQAAIQEQTQSPPSS